MKLIFEYDGKQYGFKGTDATGFCSIVDSDGVFNKQLWENIETCKTFLALARDVTLPLLGMPFLFISTPFPTLKFK
jgi:hypothetical protein